jgi:hypothetical protein
MPKMSEFKDKFIAFIDVIGFKEMIEAAESGRGRSIDEIDAILAELENAPLKAFVKRSGPKTCPNSPYVSKDLDLEITQVSDCVIASAEVSPAGVINLISHAWGAAIMLLTKGVMVRGYITRGNIQHEGTKFRGTGYHTAYAKEAGVSAFKREADEKGTPFIEIDPSVTAYIDGLDDWCAKEMFGRYVKRDEEVTAIFPFQRLTHDFIIAGYGVKFDPDRETRNNDNLRKLINKLKDTLLQYVDPSNESAMRKVRHYLDALDAQLVVCDRTDEVIERLR